MLLFGDFSFSSFVILNFDGKQKIPVIRSLWKRLNNLYKELKGDRIEGI